MLSVVLAFLIGATWGVIGGIYWKTKMRKRDEPKDKLDDALMYLGIVPREKAEIIQINKVEQFLKESEGDVSLDSVIDYDE